MRMRRLGLVLLLLWPGLCAAWAEEPPRDETRLGCERLDEWVLLPLGQEMQPKLSVTTAPDTFREGAGGLELTYVRKPLQLAALVPRVLLTGLQAVELDAWSGAATPLAATVTDRDGARFHAVATLEAGQWKRVRFAAGDFRLSDDSPVKAAAFNPDRLGGGLCLLDAGPIVGASGPNVLRLDGLLVTRQPLPVLALPAAIEGKAVAVTESGRIAKDVTIRRGGVLKITAPRVCLSANLLLEGGTLEFAGTAVALHGRFEHDLRWVAAQGSTIRLTDCVVGAAAMHSVALTGRSRLEAVRTEQAGARNFTVDVPSGCTAALEKTKFAGEFIVGPGGQVTLDDCEGALLWLTPNNGRLSLPDGKFVLSWSTPRNTGLDVQIKNSREIQWGLISPTGSNVTLQDSRLTAVAALFRGSSRQAVAGLKNGQAVADYQMPVADRNLKFTGASAVRTWNFYAAENADLALRDCVVGEVFALGNARLSLLNSTCDGSGGYVHAEGRGQLRLIKCRVTCDVVATENSAVSLEDSVVEGSVRAAGRAKVSLVNTRVTGALVRLDEAALEQKSAPKDK